MSLSSHYTPAVTLTLGRRLNLPTHSGYMPSQAVLLAYKYTYAYSFNLTSGTLLTSDDVINEEKEDGMKPIEESFE